MFPESISEQPDLLPTDKLFVYSLTTEPAVVTGYRVVKTAALDSGHPYVAQRVWQMHLTSEDTPQRILFAAARPTNG